MRGGEIQQQTLGLLEAGARQEAGAERDLAAFLSRSMPVARRVERDGAADPEVGPKQRPAQANRTGTLHLDHDLGVARDPRERAVEGSVELERRQRRRGWDDRMAERGGEAIAGAVASRLGQR